MEIWMKMTDAEHDATLAEMRRYNQWWDSLTPLQQYRSSRRSALEGCLIWRKSIRSAWGGEFFEGQLRNRQKRLLKLRIELATGQYPGSAWLEEVLIAVA